MRAYAAIAARYYRDCFGTLFLAMTILQSLPPPFLKSR
jgi:hypothetical protein